MSTISETTVRVRYAETDQMGVVYHSNYIIWLEVGRVELLRQLGFSYQEMEAEGLHLPVVEVKCRYKHPARYDDKADGRLLAEGESVHVVVGHDLKRTHLTGKYLDALHAAAEIAQPAETIRHSDTQS